MIKTAKIRQFIYLMSFFCLEIHACVYSSGVSGGSCRSSEVAPRALLEKIMRDPERALKKAQKVKSEVLSRLRSIESIDFRTKIAQTLDVYAQAEEKSPIFLLDECDVSYCELSRCNSHEYRLAYENHVVPALVSKMIEQPIAQYVSFGSGKMFQDLIILAKALAQKPDGKIEVHLIEAGYCNFCDYRNALKLPISVDLNECFLPELHGEAVSTLSQIRATASLSPDKILTIQEDYVLADQTARQFVKFLRNTFEEANVHVQLHKSKDSYLNYIREYDMPYPDIVTSADIQDDVSHMMDGVQHYSALCKEILSHKGHVHTSLLALPGRIVSYSLSNDGKDLIMHTQSISAPYSQCKRLIKYVGIGLIAAAIYYTTEIKKN